MRYLDRHTHKDRLHLFLVLPASAGSSFSLAQCDPAASKIRFRAPQRHLLTTTLAERVGDRANDMLSTTLE